MNLLLCFIFVCHTHMLPTRSIGPQTRPVVVAAGRK